jgi:transposase
MLPDLKDQFPFLKLGNSAALQQTLRQLDTALKGSFKSTKNKVQKEFPKYKRKDNTGAVCYPQYVKIVGHSLDIPKLKTTIKLQNKDLPEEFNSVTITK